MAAPARAPHPAGSGDRPERCEVTELFTMLGQPHVLAILAAFRGAGGKPLRFSTLQGGLSIPPRTLAVRLRVLVAAGLLERRSYRERPPRVEYVATAKTAELDELFTVLGRWAGQHSLSSGDAARGPAASAVGELPSSA